MKYLIGTIMMGFGCITITSAYKARKKGNDAASVAIFVILGVLALGIGFLTMLHPEAVAQTLQD